MAGNLNRVDSWKLHLAMGSAMSGFALYSLLSKVAMMAGTNPFVFSVYRDIIGFFVLMFYAFVAEREFLSKVTLPVLGFMACLGFFGCFLQQTLFLVGLDYTSVLLASAMQNCTPIFVLIIAAIFGLEEVRFGQQDGQLKILGVLLCVFGAMVLLFYKGPSLLPRLGLANATLPQRTPPLSGEVFAELLLLQWGITKWQIGALCLLFGTLSVSVYLNIQVPALAIYPAPISLMAGSVFTGAIWLFLAAVATVNDPSKWVLSGLSQFFPVIYAGFFVSGVTPVLVCWSNLKGGPIFVGAYSPMVTLISAILGYYFLGESVYLGWLIGAVAIISGLYFVTWGQHEDKQRKALLLEVIAPQPIQVVFPVKGASHLEDPLLG